MTLTRYAPSPLELTGGQWVRGPGGVMRWITDDDNDATADMLIGVLEHIAEHMPPPPLTDWICDDCGCALRTEHELCPACAVAWCREQETRHWWQQFERANRRGGANEQTVREAIRKVA
jgi:hypothetical protein